MLPRMRSHRQTTLLFQKWTLYCTSLFRRKRRLCNIRGGVSAGDKKEQQSKKNLLRYKWHKWYPTSLYPTISCDAQDFSRDQKFASLYPTPHCIWLCYIRLMEKKKNILNNEHRSTQLRKTQDGAEKAYKVNEIMLSFQMPLFFVLVHGGWGGGCAP